MMNKMIAKTGIEFNCSGVYSLVRLQDFVFSFPEEFESNEWLDLNREKRKLDELISERRADNKGCYGDMAKFSEYMYAKSFGYYSQKELYEIESSIDSPELIAVTKLFQEKVNTTDVFRVLSAFSEQGYCDVSLIILEYLNKHNRRIFNEINSEIEDEIFQIGCGFHETVIRIKQTQGKW